MPSEFVDVTQSTSIVTGRSRPGMLVDDEDWTYLRKEVAKAPKVRWLWVTLIGAGAGSLINEVAVAVSPDQTVSWWRIGFSVVVLLVAGIVLQQQTTDVGSSRDRLADLMDHIRRRSSCSAPGAAPDKEKADLISSFLTTGPVQTIVGTSTGTSLAQAVGQSDEAGVRRFMEKIVDRSKKQPGSPK